MFVSIATMLFAGAIAFAATFFVRRHARQLGIVQTPNARSSHTVPTPSGGGVGIVLGGSVVAAVRALTTPFPLVNIAGIAILVAAIGFYDDRQPLPARFRLLAQLLLTGLAIWLSVPLDALGSAGGLPLAAPLLGAVALLATVYWINLFNFMDGIDGIAASQAIFMTCGAALLAVLKDPAVCQQWPFWMLLGLAAASLGFLLLNWPPAKIFMGDAGSTYLGFMIAMLALVSMASGWLTLLQWAVLACAFVTDASVTLLRRLVLRERVFEAHRRHAYQVLSRRWKSHQRVTLTLIAINLVWALPLAYLAGVPGWGAAIAALAYLPLIGLAFYVGAGAPEETPVIRP